jgi:hypothetical protein
LIQGLESISKFAVKYDIPDIKMAAMIVLSAGTELDQLRRSNVDIDELPNFRNYLQRINDRSSDDACLELLVNVSNLREDEAMPDGRVRRDSCSDIVKTVPELQVIPATHHCHCHRCHRYCNQQPLQHFATDTSTATNCNYTNRHLSPSSNRYFLLNIIRRYVPDLSISATCELTCERM